MEAFAYKKITVKDSIEIFVKVHKKNNIISKKPVKILN